MSKSLLKIEHLQLFGVIKSSQILLQTPCSELKLALHMNSQTRLQFLVRALLATLLCWLVLCLKLCGPEAMLLLESLESFISSKMSSWYLWVRKKSQKAEDIKKNPDIYLFGKLIIFKTLKRPRTLKAMYSSEPSLRLPTRHPKKAYCQPSSRALDRFQRCLDTWMPLRSWPWVPSRLNLAWWVAD